MRKHFFCQKKHGPKDSIKTQKQHLKNNNAKNLLANSNAPSRANIYKYFLKETKPFDPIPPSNPIRNLKNLESPNRFHNQVASGTRQSMSNFLDNYSFSEKQNFFYLAQCKALTNIRVWVEKKFLSNQIKNNLLVGSQGLSKEVNMDASKTSERFGIDPKANGLLSNRKTPTNASNGIDGTNVNKIKKEKGVIEYFDEDKAQLILSPLKINSDFISFPSTLYPYDLM